MNLIKKKKVILKYIYITHLQINSFELKKNNIKIGSVGTTARVTENTSFYFKCMDLIRICFFIRLNLINLYEQEDATFNTHVR